MAVVEADGLVKAHGRGRASRRVLDGASISVAAGEVVAVRGRSGSGKSTLLHLLGALDRPDAGRIVVDGQRLDGRGDRELARLRARLIGFVFQFFHLVPELSGVDNVLLPTRLPDVPDPVAARRRALELVSRLGLEDVASHLPHELSGGEQQRFAVARALVLDPPVLLCDEPTGNLDGEAAQIVLELIRDAASEGRAVVVVTHEPAATAAADRVVQLVDGRVA